MPRFYLASVDLCHFRTLAYSGTRRAVVTAENREKAEELAWAALGSDYAYNLRLTEITPHSWESVTIIED